jgi:small subunit ribosomal protein S5
MTLFKRALKQRRRTFIGYRLRRTTIPHTVTAKFEATRVIIKPAAPGTGLVAGGAMRPVLNVLGVKDAIAKIIGSSNPHNVVRATMAALMSLEDAITVAQRRNIPLQKVFKGTYELPSESNAGAQ